jgi:hypothetical protein
LRRAWRQQGIIGRPAAAPQFSRNPQKIWHHSTVRKGMDMPRVRKYLPVFGGLLYVMLSVLFGSVWYAALSLMMSSIER